MCRVEWPWDGAPEVWGGVYGNAKVVPGEAALAVTSDGKRHPL